jgi:type IV pilus assembly protein PilM
MASTVWGLDIGQASIKAVKMERAGSVAQVTSFDVIEVEPGEDESTRPARTHAAMAELLRRRKIGNDPVIVAVPGNQTFFRPFELPPAPASRLASIVGFEARNQIPFPIDEVLWDFKQLAPSDDGQMRVGLIAVRRELIDQIIGLVKQFNLRLEAIQVAPFALYNLMQYEFGPGQPWVILDGGARVTDFVVADGEEFWFRPLPQSGNDLTRCLEQKFRMTFEEAEELKLKMGGSKQAGQIFQVIEPMLRNMAGDIQRTIGYYKGIRKNADLQNIMAVGSSFRLPGIIEFLQNAIDADITYLNGLRRVRLGPMVDAAWWQEELPSMAVALGLGIQGVGLAPVAMELLPESIRRERMLRKKRPIVAVTVGLALAASVAGLLAGKRELGALKANLKQIDAGLAKVNNFERKYKAASAQTPALEQGVETLARDTARDRGWAVDCLNTILKVKAPDGSAVLGTEATSEDGGVYLKNVVVSRGDPFIGAGRNTEQSIMGWYQKLRVATAQRPLAAIVQAEVAGPPYEQGKEKAIASTARAQALKEALNFSSKVYLKDDEETTAALGALGITGKVLAGAVSRSAEDEKAGRISLLSAPGATPKLIETKHIERLAWIRRAKLGTGWEYEERRVTPRAAPGEEPDKIQMRQYLSITLGLVYDDGSTKLASDTETATR